MLQFEKLSMEQHFIDIARKEENTILNVFKKQKGFVSFEESKDLISADRIINHGVFIQTEYRFNGKLVLIVYAPKCAQENDTFKTTVEYREFL